jgi:hypothetical protein
MQTDVSFMCTSVLVHILFVCLLNFLIFLLHLNHESTAEVTGRIEVYWILTLIKVLSF